MHSTGDLTPPASARLNGLPTCLVEGLMRALESLRYPSSGHHETCRASIEILMSWLNTPYLGPSVSLSGPRVPFTAINTTLSRCQDTHPSNHMCQFHSSATRDLSTWHIHVSSSFNVVEVRGQPLTDSSVESLCSLYQFMGSVFSNHSFQSHSFRTKESQESLLSAVP